MKKSIRIYLVATALLISGTVWGQEEGNKLVPVAKYGFMDKTGKMVVSLQYDDAKEFSEGLAAVCIGNWSDSKWGFINEKGEMIIKPQFPNVSSFSSGLAYATNQEGQYGFIDKTGKWVVSPQYDNADDFKGGYAPVYVGDWGNGKWGIIDKNGKVSVEPIYESMPELFGGGLMALLTIGDKKTLIDNKGKTIMDLSTLDGFSIINDFPGWASVSVDGKYGIINEKGWLLEPKYDHISLHNGFAVVGIDEKWGALTKDGKWVFEPTENASFSWLSDDEEDISIIGYNEKYGLLNKTGWCVEPVFDDAIGFSEGLAGVYKDDKWGFIDKTGKMVIEPRFDGVSPFENGVAQVVLDGKTGTIDKKGTFTESK